LGFGLGTGAAGAAAGAALAAALPRILNITVPHVGHLPLMALRPFFMVSSTPSAMGFLALHLTQYPSDIKNLPLALYALNGLHRLSGKNRNVNVKRNRLIYSHLQNKKASLRRRIAKMRRTGSLPENFEPLCRHRNSYAGPAGTGGKRPVTWLRGNLIGLP
jgi:hypothetical protein